MNGEVSFETQLGGMSVAINETTCTNLDNGREEEVEMEEVEEEKRKTKTVQNILESQVYIFSFVLSFDFCEKTGSRLEAQLKG